MKWLGGRPGGCSVAEKVLAWLFFLTIRTNNLKKRAKNFWGRWDNMGSLTIIKCVKDLFRFPTFLTHTHRNRPKYNYRIFNICRLTFSPKKQIFQFILSILWREPGCNTAGGVCIHRNLVRHRKLHSIDFNRTVNQTISISERNCWILATHSHSDSVFFHIPRTPNRATSTLQKPQSTTCVAST